MKSLNPANPISLDSNPEEVIKLFQSCDCILTDCDGVLWKDSIPVEGAAEVLSHLKLVRKRVFYVTNNSTKSREECAAKLKKMGFPATKEEIAGTAHLVASHLQKRNFSGKAYVIGSAGLSTELTNAGIDHFGIGPDAVTHDNMTEVFSTRIERDVHAVIVGFDLHISYTKLLRAATYLKDPNVLFLGTNADEQFPADGDNVIPGTGTMVAAVETCSLRKAEILGKPSPLMFQALAEEHNIDPSRAIMIGDRANTDILFGKRVGMKTLLVYTGVTSETDVKSWKESQNPDDQLLVPDFTIQSLGDLLPILKSFE